MTSFNCIYSFKNVLRVIIWDVTKRRCKSAREREAIPTASRRYYQKKENKTGISGCDSFVVAYFEPATSIDR